MEVTSHGVNLLFFSVIYFSFLIKTSNNEEILEKMYGREIKLLAYQVRDL